uniref:Pathogen-related protein n=1 Tax=Aegilops tauschii TaxID=37682 RepID=R7WA18_AEGTA
MASAEGGDKYRSFLHGDGEKNTVWRHGFPPNYDLVNKLFEEESPHIHVSSNVVHMVNTDCDRNGRRGLWRRRCSACSRAGRWRWSTRGFAIEVLDVYSGPPRVAFKFRHWGYMEGPFKGHPPHGQRVEFFGVCVFHVNEHTRVEKAEYFYERGNFLAGFLSSPAAAAASASGCPVMRAN